MNDQNLFKRYANLSLQELCDELFRASSLGHLDDVKYLLTSPELKNKPLIHYADHLALVKASVKGTIEVVEYLLNFPNYSSQDLTDASLIKACINARLDLAKFLLDSKSIPHNANIHVKDDYIFKELLMAKNKEMLSYLIIDREIIKTKEIDTYLNKEHYNLNSFVLEIKGLFELRNLRKELGTELLPNDIKNKKSKL